MAFDGEDDVKEIDAPRVAKMLLPKVRVRVRVRVGARATATATATARARPRARARARPRARARARVRSSCARWWAGLALTPTLTLVYSYP